MSRRCKQIKCSFYLQGHCKSCNTCNTEPYIINESCKKCLDCEGVPDELRFGDTKAMKKAKALQEIKVIHKALGEMIKGMEQEKEEQIVQQEKLMEILK